MSTQAPLVLVTGVSGYIASWVAYAALDRGYRVRGTVRTLSNENKIQHLRDLCPHSKYKIELVEADLTSDAGWDKAVEGCDYILHLASPFPLKEPEDPQDVIRPAVEGTLHVLRAAGNMTVPPKRVVVTSSIVAVAYGTNKEIYTEEDWTDIDNNAIPVSSYGKSKTLAEKAAWDYLKKLPKEKQFELSTINPSLVLGPMLSNSSCSSAEVMKQLVLAELPGVPNIPFNLVSVLDVARAHLLAMTVPEAAGKRFLLDSAETTFPEIAAVLAEEFRPHNYKCVTFNVPNWLLSTLAFFGNTQAKNTVKLLDPKKTNPVNTRTILNLPLRDDFKTLVLQMTYAAIDAGIIPDHSEGKKISHEYERPQFDLSMVPMAVEN